MKNLLRYLAFFLMVGGAYAQSKLPACQGRDISRWSNCVGSNTFASGNKYVGEFKDGKRNGQGTFTFSDGEKYVGEFKDDKIDGQGTYTFANGNKYVGEHKDSKINGQGTFTFADGSKYVGEHKDGKRNGQFTATFANGNKYVGEYKDNKRNGQGTEYASNGSIINQGIWADGSFVRSEPVQQAVAPLNNQLLSSSSLQGSLPACPSSGYFDRCFGTYTFPSGEKYVGEFKNNLRHGQGTFYALSGTVVSEGIWVDGKFIKSESVQRVSGNKKPACSRGELHNCIGTIEWAGGQKYVGEMMNNNANGLGTMYLNGRVVSQGKFVQNKLVESIDISNWNDEEKKYYFNAFSKLKNLNWMEKVTAVVADELRKFLDVSTEGLLQEIPPPIFPLALKLSQDKWETNKEFEDRVASSRAERQKEIERIQASYKAKVDRRNSEIQKLELISAQKEKELPIRKKELINQALFYINLQITPKTAILDPERGILFVDASVDGGKVERYEYLNAPIQLRREAITSVGNIKMTPEFFVTDSGQFGIKALNVEFGNLKVAGTSTQTNVGSQTLRLATIDVPIASMPALTQQSALTVDRNQVEQILYRDENESLRKRLEEQRKSQEFALAEETRKASAETSKLRAEAEIARNRQRELELQLASTSRTPINYGKALNAHALVIGNGAYSGSSRLPNPINDARSMSEKLRGLGFIVTEALDADRTKLVSALSQFSRTAVNADITLLFYAGHGVQITGTNYMLPIDLNLNDIAQAPLQGISLNDVVEKYLPGKTKLVFLDACRDNPLMQVASRGVSRGLAPINVSEGTLISYATKDGSVAQDGDGKNSPFTSALLEHIGDPDDIAVVLRKVREKVMKTTGNKQQPWEYGSLTGGALVLSAIKPK
jgi:hypothetical protein